MSTYEHVGGSAAHDPSFDRDDVTELEESTLLALEFAQTKAAELDTAVSELRTQLHRSLSRLVKVGDIIDHRSFGRINVVSGNSRNAHRFEVASEARLREINTTHPELTKFYIEAWPVNDGGKRMSGRAGNSSRGQISDVLILGIQLCDFSIDDRSSGNDLVMRLVARAAASGGAAR
jgi:hypothetical protein